MKDYCVTVYYQGRAEYTVQARSELDARRQAIQAFEDGYPSEGVDDLESLEVSGVEVEDPDENSPEFPDVSELTSLEWREEGAEAPTLSVG